MGLSPKYSDRRSGQGHGLYACPTTEAVSPETVDGFKSKI